ncbi:MAG: hypothetical protein IJ192_14805 [Clostridia bacterium]|nr:hypothetical protein [Clostridia bacterium]
MVEWIVFYAPSGEELAAYTVQGTFFDELKSTKELLAFENNLNTSDIKVILEKRSK